MRYLLASLLVLCASHAPAKIPAEYNPVIVESPFSFSERVVDLTGSL